MAEDEAGAFNVRMQGAPANPSRRQTATTSSGGKNIYHLPSRSRVLP